MNKQNEGWTKVAALNVKVPSGAIRDWERLLVICSLSTVRCLWASEPASSIQFPKLTRAK
jgi:hypothetical protein